MPREQAGQNGKSWMAEGAAWVLVLTGIVLAIAAGRETASLLAAPQSWVQAEARVVRTSVRQLRHRAPLSQRESSDGYQVIQELVYFRQGSRYQEAVSLGVYSTQQEAEAQARMAAQPGTVFPIWVDAANPMRVRLEPITTSLSWKLAPAAFLKLAGNLQAASPN